MVFGSHHQVREDLLDISVICLAQAFLQVEDVDLFDRGTDFDVLNIVNAKAQTLVSKAFDGHDGTLEYALAEDHCNRFRAKFRSERVHQMAGGVRVTRVRVVDRRR